MTLIFPVLDKEAFERLLGPCKDIMEKKEKYEAQVEGAFSVKVFYSSSFAAPISCSPAELISFVGQRRVK